MSKFYGKVGFGVTSESSPGVWTEEITEKNYYGDVNRLIRKYDRRDQVNDDLNVNHEISIMADPYASEHFASIRYVEWMGVKWKVPTVEVRYPRLILSIGGVYNG